MKHHGLQPHVLVGYRGRASSTHALRRGVQEARLRRLPLTLCHAWSRPVRSTRPEQLATGEARHAATRVLESGVSRIRDMAPSLRVSGRLHFGPPAAALLREAPGAALIVLGAPARTDSGQAHAESVACTVSAHANCPILIARTPQTTDARIVVGVDGSAASEAALGLAFEEAALRDQEVHVVHGCGRRSAGDRDRPSAKDAEDIRRRIRFRLERPVSVWKEKYPQVEAMTALVFESPRQTLIRAAADADVLFVGNQGDNSRAAHRLGSISQDMVRNAPCSVAIAHSVDPMF